MIIEDITSDIASIENAMKSCEEMKMEGNRLFGTGDYDGAMRSWRKAIAKLPIVSSTVTRSIENETVADFDEKSVDGSPQLVEDTDENRKFINEYAAILRNNCAQVLLKRGMYEKAIRECDLAIALDPKSTKAYWRRGKARIGIWNKSEKDLTLLDDAIKEFEKILVIQPGNLAAVEAIEDVEDLKDEAKENHGSKNGNNVNHSKSPDIVNNDVTFSQFDESYVRKCIDGVRGDVQNGNGAISRVILRHMKSDANLAGKNNNIGAATQFPEYTVGQIKIEGAFESISNLTDACNFVRSQHMTAQADAACILVMLREITYPQVWISGDWPRELWKPSHENTEFWINGLFAEIHKHGVKRTYYASLIESDDGSKVLSDDLILLPSNCSISDVNVLP